MEIATQTPPIAQPIKRQSGADSWTSRMGSKQIASANNAMVTPERDSGACAGGLFFHRSMNRYAARNGTTQP
jgi:hypothetical protein